MTDPALRAMLEASASPLAEANPLSLDEFFDRVNAKLLAGIPEALTETPEGLELLRAGVAQLRLDRQRFIAEQAAKAASGRRSANARTPAKSVAEALDDLEGL